MSVNQPRELVIELLAIDLNRCTRCLDSLANIEMAVELIAPVLQVMDVRAVLRKIVVTSEAEAIRYRLASSPTIRIDGRDIVLETVESACDACTDLCGCEDGIDCRIWPYRGKEYTEAPVGMVVEAILRAIIANPAQTEDTEFHGVPANLRNFFRSKQRADTDCCSADARNTCCPPDEKTACCASEQTATCGCR